MIIIQTSLGRTPWKPTQCPTTHIKAVYVCVNTCVLSYLGFSEAVLPRNGYQCGWIPASSQGHSSLVWLWWTTNAPAHFSGPTIHHSWNQSFSPHVVTHWAARQCYTIWGQAWPSHSVKLLNLDQRQKSIMPENRPEYTYVHLLHASLFFLLVKMNAYMVWTQSSYHKSTKTLRVCSIGAVLFVCFVVVCTGRIDNGSVAWEAGKIATLNSQMLCNI